MSEVQKIPGATSDARERVKRVLSESVRVKESMEIACGDEIAAAGLRLADCFRSGHKTLLFGNGGSASDAQHIAGEWVGRYRGDRPALPAIALTANSSDTTAIANDYGFEHVFVRGVEAHGREGDVAIAISTSGDSRNVIAAVEAARARGLTTIGLLGKGGGRLADAVDLAIIVPSDTTARIQEGHITIGHILCEIVDAELFPDSVTA